MTFVEPTLEDIKDRALSAVVAARVAAHEADPTPTMTLLECDLFGLDCNELLDEVDREGRA